MRSSRYFLLPLLFVLAAPVQAQTATDPGSMVRIRSKELSKGRATGVLERVTADSLIVAGLAVSRSSIDRIDVSTGRKSHTLMGMGIGFVAGVGVGALVCRAACGDNSNGSGLDGVYAAVGAGVGGVLGLGIGALIGSRKTEQWEKSSLSTLRISPTAGPNGAMGFSLGFQF